jgi:thioredoxin-like negative regulator of GroEL
MPVPPKRARRRVPYWVRFSATVFSLTAFTSVFVLVVLPQRFVLQAGLVESGITFPSVRPPYFAPPTPPTIAPRIRPPAPPIQPGPGEAFWNGVLPLLRSGQLERTVSLFRAYLARHPDDADVWREFADVLTKLERYDEAERIYVQLRASSDDPALTLLLARLLRDKGAPERSLALYHELIELRPEDEDLRHEYAQVLTWSQEYDQAAVQYRWLIDRHPSDHMLGLELARVLYWNGQLNEALDVLATLPASGSHAQEASQLRAMIESELPVATAPVDTLLEQARQAVVAQQFVEATRLYRALLARDPESAELWLEWADFLQYQREDLPAARDALLHLSTLRDLTHDERFRIVQLHAWTGNEAEARVMLLGLLQEDSTSAAEWALLGDLYRFGNARLAARDAYRSALTLDPENLQAIEGRAALEQQTTELIETRERPSAGPEVLYFGDSDAYRRLDLGARATFQLGTTILVARGGYRALEGVALSGAPVSQSGPYLEVEAAQWWRMGTVRTAVSAGFEQLDALGTEPTFAVAVAVPDAGGTSLEATYEHGPAFHRTVTLESVLGAVRSDHLEASAYRELGGGWSLAGSGSATSLRGGGEANWRFGGFATLRRQISNPFSIALTSQLLTFTESAPVLETRRLYWDPRMFVAGGVQLEARARPTGAWNIYGRVTGGAGFVRERTASEFDLVPQFSTEAGLTYDTRRLFVTGSLAYLRGREGTYESFGANVSLGVRY